jgi:large subunit ribosomal protein L22
VESKAVARYIRISPRKARLVVDTIRGRDLDQAQQILDFSDRAAARVVAKVLRSAAANAENNNGLSPEGLYVSKVFVDEGPTLKRFRPRAMGRATRINKRTCHITVILDEREPEKVIPKKRRIRKAATAARDAVRGKGAEEEEGEEVEEVEEAPKTAKKPAAKKAAAAKPAAKKPAAKKAASAKAEAEEEEKVPESEELEEPEDLTEDADMAEEGAQVDVEEPEGSPSDEKSEE